MPKKGFSEEDEDQNEQQWNPIVLKREPIIIKNNVVLTNDQFISMMRNRRELCKLSVLQLNTKCKFPYKYTIRDIESGRSIPSAIEIKTISSVLELEKDDHIF